MEVLRHATGTLLLMLMLCGSARSAEAGTEKCKLTVETDSERLQLKRLAPLLNKNFSVSMMKDKESYTYVFQLCGDADGVPEAGVLQIDEKKSKTVVGRYNSTKAIGGSDWVMLIYENGDHYKTHCDKANRKAIIMISCDRNTAVGPLEAIVEDRERSDCFYLFELDASAVCPIIESKLSTGAIILIVLVCLVAFYLIGGFLYQRLVVGAKGMDQIPNYAFWAEVGNLSADGCDFVCRSRKREEPNAYRGVASEPEEEPEERDDHLLPM
uniref:Cation-dependent mannose-6-phosphate receptor n=1 Tax=Neogobius melanostomus TaxID=47308 RepID=A0A8C6SH49_9GOBI